MFFVFIIAFFVELETAEGWLVQRVHLCMWTAAGHEQLLKHVPRVLIFD